MKNLSTIKFKNTKFDIIDQNGMPWLKSNQIDDALGYIKSERGYQNSIPFTSKNVGVRKLYKRNKEEFTEKMTTVLDLPTPGGVQKTRIFSPRGCFLLGMFAKTKEGAEFREWALDVLEKRFLGYKIRHANLAWVAARADGKVIRREETDMIKEFVNYAMAQGSRNAVRYYVTLSKLVNKNLFLGYLEIALHKPKDFRGMLDKFQIMQLAAADILVAKTIKKGMDNGLHYKDIYQLAREKVEAFAKVIGMTPVLPEEPKDLQLTD